MAEGRYPTNQQQSPGPGGFINYPAAPNIGQWLASQGLISIGAMAPPKSGGFGFSASFGGPGSGGSSAPQGGNVPAGNATNPGGSWINDWSSGYQAAPNAGGGGGSWWGQAANWAKNNPQLVGAGLGAVSGYFQGKEGQGGGSVSGSSSTGPYMADVLGPHLMQILQGQQSLYQGAMAGGGGGGGGGGRASWESIAPDYGGADLMRRAGEAGLDFGNSPLAQANLQALGQVTSPQGYSGMAGYNPLAEALAQGLSGSNLGGVNDLLGQFVRGGYMGQAPGGTLGSSNFSGGISGGGGGGGNYGAGGVVPDATGSGLFGQQVRRIFDEQANEKVLSDLIASATQDALGAHWQSLADLDASSQQGGRMGGSYYSALRGNQQGAFDDAVSGMSAGIRYEDLNNRRNAVLAALGQVNTRDLAAMGDMTQRAGINASAASAAGANAAQRYAAELAHALGLRGQDLQALGMMSGNQQFGLGTLGTLAGLRSGDYSTALSGLSTLSGQGLQGLGLGLGAGEALGNYQLGMGQLGQQDAARRSAAANRAAAAPQNALNDYLRTALAIGSMGQTGTNSTQYPGQGGSALGGALQGAIGGWMAGGNLFGQQPA